MKKSLHYLSLLSAAFIWSTSFFVMKDTLTDIPEFSLLFTRFSLAAFVTALILIVQKQNPFRYGGKGYLLGIALGLAFIFQTVGLQYVTAVTSAFITNTLIIFVPIFELVLIGKWPKWKQLLAISIAMAGFLLVTGGNEDLGVGEILTFIGAAMFALHIVLTSWFIKQEIDFYVLNFQQFLGMSLLTGATCIAFNQPLLVSMSSTMVLNMGYLVLFASVIAYALQMWGQRKVHPVTTSIIITLDPLIVASIGVFLGIYTAPIAWLGGILIAIASIQAEIDLTKYLRKLLPLKL